MQRASRHALGEPCDALPARQQVERFQPSVRARPVPARPEPVQRPPPRHAQRIAVISGGLLGIGLVGALAMVFLCMSASLIGAAALFGGGKILPGVRVGGVAVGGMNEAEAAQALASAWDGGNIVLRDGDRSWSAAAADLGITIDAQASARPPAPGAAPTAGSLPRCAPSPRGGSRAGHQRGLGTVGGYLEQPVPRSVRAQRGRATGQRAVQERPAQPGRALNISPRSTRCAATRELWQMAQSTCHEQHHPGDHGRVGAGGAGERCQPRSSCMATTRSATSGRADRATRGLGGVADRGIQLRQRRRASPDPAGPAVFSVCRALRRRALHQGRGRRCQDAEAIRAGVAEVPRASGTRRPPTPSAPANARQHRRGSWHPLPLHPSGEPRH